MSFVAGAVLVLFSWVGVAPQQPDPAADTWAALRFLLGTWEGTSSGQPGQGTVRREYRLVLRDRFIEVRNTSTYPPQVKNPKGEVHEDLGYISYDRSRKTFVFRQFHAEGFVNTYVGQATGPGTVVFTTEGIENIPAGWRARETYRSPSADELIERFELAEPEKEFALYSETTLRRVR
jgi:hypothetical protein